MHFLLVAAFAAAAVPAPATRPSDPVLVRAVVDGDTIDVAPGGRVRLLGIDAPEIGRVFDTSAPFAREARDRLSGLVLHRWVRLQQDTETVDVYNRRLAYVVLEDGLFVNAQLVRDGLARVSARLPLARLDELKRAEADAQAFRRGMWGASPAIPAGTFTSAARMASSPAGRYTASSGGGPSRPRAGRSRAAVRRAPPSSSSTDAQPTVRQRSSRRSPRVGRAPRAGRAGGQSPAAPDSARRRDAPRRQRRAAPPQ